MKQKCSCGNTDLDITVDGEVYCQCGAMWRMSDHDNRDMRPVVSTLVMIALFVICLFFVMRIEAQADNEPAVCTGLPAFIVGEDLTDDMYELYSVSPQSEQWYTIVALFDVDFAYSRYNGFYNWNGTWVIVNKLADGNYRLWAGVKWEVGIDGQLHNPTCYLIVPPVYEWYIGLFDKCQYPTCNMQ